MHNGQWRGALMFSFICPWINGWVNNGEAGGLRCHRAHYDVTVMLNRSGLLWRALVSILLSYNREVALRWRHNERDSVSNHQPHDCLLNRLFRRRSKKTSKLRVTGLCARNSPGTGEFPAQMASYAENVLIWWRHHGQNMSQLELFLIHNRSYSKC